MRSKYPTICIGVLVLAAASAMADDLEAQKRGQSLPAAPPLLSDAPRADFEAQKQGQGPGVAPVSPSDAPRIDLEAQKQGQSLAAAAPVSPADAPSVDLEGFKQLGQRAVIDPAARSLEKQTERVSQMAIEAIPLKRGSGPRILPFPDANGRPIPIGGV